MPPWRAVGLVRRCPWRFSNFPAAPHSSVTHFAMLAIAEAQERVLACAGALPPVREALGRCLGLVLAEDAASDLDLPPYDKAMVDGYAVRSADLREGRGELAVVEEVHAGQVPTLALGPGQATRIMTGAPVARGADAVGMVEHTRVLAEAGDGSARCDTSLGRVEVAGPKPVRAGINIMARGLEMRRGGGGASAGGRG